MHSSQKSLTLISKSTVFPDQKSTLQNLKLSVSDLPMLSCNYIQKGCLFTSPPLPIHALIALLKSGLSKTLSHFPPLAGRFRTDSDGHVYIICNDKGVDFIHANAGKLYIRDILGPIDVPEIFKEFFPFDRTVSFDGHFKSLVAMQITELVDGIFVGITMNHAVVDGTSFWNFFNTFAEVCRGGKNINRCPDFRRDSVLISPAVLKFPEGGPTVTFSGEAPLRERIFSFSRESILKLKSIVNYWKLCETAIENIGKQNNDDIYMRNTAIVKSNGKLSETAIEILGKQSNDRISKNNTANSKSGVVSKSHETAEILSETAIEILGKQSNDKISTNNTASKVKNGSVSRPHETAAEAEVSSFLSLCALLWRSVTRARNLPPSKTTTFRMAVNCRHRIEPKLDPYYFGNAIQSAPTWASSGDVTSRDLRWCAEHLSKTVREHGDPTVRRFVEDWERNPTCFPLGNSDGASITMGSSPRFPMYDNDFGWGRPMAVRSGGANKFDGKISAFPGREGGGSVDLEVVLAPETMAGIESDLEFMQYVSS